MKWQNVYVFISSTFNDMHAERDYLIKRVFPELRLWCANHKLKLIDIDLRWGVSEKDATENKRVVEVCLNNVDKCRPFLLCLLGQRRGWIPNFSDINENTLLQFPGLKQYIGKQSITELEIIHGLLHPLKDGQTSMRHAFFYYREPDYIENIISEDVRHIFQREDIEVAQSTPLDETIEDVFESFKTSLKEKYDVATYSAEWNPDRVSLELKNVQGKDLSAGRLMHFQVGDVSLANYVLKQLKEAISEEFPEHFTDTKELDDLERELNHQDNFLFSAGDSYISRSYEEEKLLDYLKGDVNKPCIFMADAGMGKTSMLAFLIQRNLILDNMLYRFIGTSSVSSDVDRTLHQLAEEFAKRGFVTRDDLEEAKSDIMLKFPSLLNKVKGKCCIILDAVDQWNHLTPASFRWLPESLPDNIRILISIKKDGQTDVLKYLMEKDYIVKCLDGISDDGEKAAIIEGYLASFLKDIDDAQIGHILRLPGSGNPLYLKIVLNELRIHGSFDTLMDQLQKNYGITPKEAFQMVLNRLETEEFGEGMPSAPLVKYVLGTIGCSTEGVHAEEFVSICKGLIPETKDMADEDIMDAVYGLVRHLSMYLVIDGNRIDFLYDSFRQAVNERYQDDYTQFHHLLAMIYSRYCYKTGGAKYDVTETSYLTNYIYHATECSKEWAELILTDPWFVYRLLSKISAGKTASYFRKIAEKYSDSEEYIKIAEVMEKYSMRLNIGPNTLFDTLKRYVGFDNSLSYRLCDKASKVMELEYYYPVREELASGITAERELNTYAGNKDGMYTVEFFVWGQYIVYVDKDTILLQNIYTEEIEKQFKLPHMPHRAYVFRDYLYVHYTKVGDMALGDIETFRLPTMESVFFNDKRPKLPTKFDWYTIAYGAHGIQYQYAMDRDETHPELYVYNMNTGAVQLHSTFAGDLPKKRDYLGHKATWCNEYMMEEVALFDKCRIWHVPTGTLILETDCDWHNFVACEQDTMWYVSITREGHLTAYHYKKENEKDILFVERFEMINRPLKRVQQIGVLSGNLYLFFDSGDFYVFNQEFKFLGRQKLPFKIDKFMTGSFSGNQFLYSDGRYMLFKYKTQLLFFDEQKCMSSLLETMELNQNTDAYTALQFGQHLALLGKQGCHSLNLRTLRYDYSQKYPGYSFYEPTIIHVGSNRYIADKRGDKQSFEVLMLNSQNLSVGLRFYDEIPEGVLSIEFAFYQYGIVGVVFENRDSQKKEVREHKSNPELLELSGPKEQKVETENYETYTIAYYNTKEGFKCVDIWKPDISVTANCVQLYTWDNTPYLVFSDVYVDLDHSEIQIYHAITKELVFSYRYDHTTFHIGSKDGFFEIDSQLYIRCFDYETSDYHLWAIDIAHKCINDHIVDERLNIGNHGRELYLYRSFDSMILIYDLDKKEITHELETRHRRFCYGAMRKDNRFLVLLSGGICEVYDKETMEYLYSQMLLPNYSYVKDLTDTDMIYTSKNSSDYVIFKAGNTRDL